MFVNNFSPIQNSHSILNTVHNYTVINEYYRIYHINEEDNYMHNYIVCYRVYSKAWPRIYRDAYSPVDVVYLTYILRA